jgi:hypothetical protein
MRSQVNMTWNNAPHHHTKLLLLLFIFIFIFTKSWIHILHFGHAMKNLHTMKKI